MANILYTVANGWDRHDKMWLFFPARIYTTCRPGRDSKPYVLHYHTYQYAYQFVGDILGGLIRDVRNVVVAGLRIKLV